MRRGWRTGAEDGASAGFAGVLGRRPTPGALRVLEAQHGRSIECGPLRLTAPSGRICGDQRRAMLALDGCVAGDGAGLNEVAFALDLLRGGGAAASARLRGSFALAYWDGAADELFLAADHLGRRTVFYVHVDGALFFSTRLRTLLALPDVSRDLDERFLATFVSDVPPQSDATFYAAIRRVPAACTARFRPDGGVSVQRYWSVDWDRRIRYARDDDYVEEARALLDQAVRRQLPTVGPVVCQLSGGFDSSAVAATAARLRPADAVSALTLAPPDGAPRFERPSRMSDERPGAAAVARMHPNIELRMKLGDDGFQAAACSGVFVASSVSTPSRNLTPLMTLGN